MILIVGGAGYIGSHVNKILHLQGYQTVVFDNLSQGHQALVQWGDFFLGDLADLVALRTCFQKYPITTVMHFSAFASVPESVLNPEKYYHNNVANTLNLLQVMREFKVNYFIFSSTCAVYGEPQFCPLTEDHPLQPINAYGRSKLMVENILADYSQAYGLKYASLRYFNAAGADPDGQIGEAHLPEQHLIPLAIFAAQGQRPALRVFGQDYPTPDGTCLRDYIHVNDLAVAHIQAITYLQNQGVSTVFNLGNNQGFSVLEIAKEVELISGQPMQLDFAPRRAGDPARLIGSFAKAQQLLAWQPQYDLKSIIATAWQWHQTELFKKLSEY